MKRSHFLLLTCIVYSFVVNFTALFAQSTSDFQQFFMESVLEGKLGKDKLLSMKITVKDSIITGYCIDSEQQVKNKIEGLLLKKDKSSFFLKELNKDNKVIGTYKGTIALADIDGWDWKGVWEAKGKSKKKKFTLHEFSKYTVEQEAFSNSRIGIKNYTLFLSNLNNDSENRESCYEVNIHYPQLINLPKKGLQDSINQKISKLLHSRKLISKYKENDKYINVCKVRQNEKGEDIHDKAHASSYNVEMLTSEILSLSYSLSEDLGGEHHNETYGYINYDLLTGQEIRLEELFNPESHYVKFITAYCLTTLVNDLIHNAKEGETPPTYKMLKAAVFPNVKNFTNFSLHKEALIVMFPYYTLGRNWEHRINEYIVIPYEKLKPYFRPDGLISKHLYRY